eukprot:UN12574
MASLAFANPHINNKDMWYHPRPVFSRTSSNCHPSSSLIFCVCIALVTGSPTPAFNNSVEFSDVFCSGIHDLDASSKNDPWR